MEDLHNAGGVPAVLAELDRIGAVDLDMPTVTGRTLRENVATEGAWTPMLSGPLTTLTPARAGWQCSGATSPPRAQSSGRLRWREDAKHTGPARVFDSEEEGIAQIRPGRSSRETW